MYRVIRLVYTADILMPSQSQALVGDCWLRMLMLRPCEGRWWQDWVHNMVIQYTVTYTIYCNLYSIIHSIYSTIYNIQYNIFSTIYLQLIEICTKKIVRINRTYYELIVAFYYIWFPCNMLNSNEQFISALQRREWWLQYT